MTTRIRARRGARLAAFFILLVVSSSATQSAGAEDSLRIADLGRCDLESGSVIQECRLGYRTYGQLNESRSNAILFPTWFSGRSASLVSFLGTDALLDTTKYYVVLVDAFGNGVSSSPSNSEAQPGRSFPVFTIRDMVAAQHRLLTEKLGIDSLHAVVGLSMGGMQAFEWAVSFPAFAERIISIAGTPRQTSFDLLLWETQAQAIDLLGDNATAREIMRVVMDVHSLALETPQKVNERSTEDFRAEIDARAESAASHDPLDWASQLRAMIHHNIYRRFENDIEETGRHIEAQMLVIVDEQDLTVNPRPSKEFAERTGARLIRFNTKCGHLVFSCSAEAINEAVSRFLAE